MRFLLDQNLSARLASLLTEAGHDAVCVAELGLSRADDRTILDGAAADDRVLIAADTDFGALSAQAHRRRPSHPPPSDHPGRVARARAALGIGYAPAAIRANGGVAQVGDALWLEAGVFLRSGSRSGGGAALFGPRAGRGR